MGIEPTMADLQSVGCPTNRVKPYAMVGSSVTVLTALTTPEQWWQVHLQVHLGTPGKAKKPRHTNLGAEVGGGAEGAGVVYAMSSSTLTVM